MTPTYCQPLLSPSRNAHAQHISEVSHALHAPSTILPAFPSGSHPDTHTSTNLMFKIIIIKSVLPIIILQRIIRTFTCLHAPPLACLR